ncbi:MAG: family 43 glycosylhydrolase [Clostridia bacterium]|nr:family 43 glycosylhydrolase [Clostridia bacterium]
MIFSKHIRRKTVLSCKDINIRDPFVLYENGKYYMYGTRAKNFGIKTGGFDVYMSDDLKSWSRPHECFNSKRYRMNFMVNWAPEVHKYKGKYYMLATFTRKSCRMRGTFVLRADSPLGPFVPHSRGPVTPEEWECLDGTLYIGKDGKPYIVFCHEHTQIIDGTVCYAPLSDDLTEIAGEAVTLFKASEPYWADKSKSKLEHRITDGPFMYRTKKDELLMLWSTYIKGQYAECLVRFTDGEIGTAFEHLEPIVDNDGGHGMVFSGKEDKLFLTYHTPNTKGSEHPHFVSVEDKGDCLLIRE